MSRSLKYNSGFTLIELLTVIAIIGLLVSMTTMGIVKSLEKGKIGRAKADLKHIADAIDAYRIEYNTAPPAQYDVLAGKDLDSNPATSSESPSDIIYLQRLNLGNQQLSAFFDVWADPEAPYVYIPAYARNVEVVRNFLRDNGYNANYLTFNGLLNEVKGSLRDKLRIPPSKFDVFVVMSAGPDDPEQTFGGLKPDLSDLNLSDGLSSEEKVEIRLRRLTAYVLATTDKNGNFHLDYDFESRSKKMDGWDPATQQTEPLPNGTLRGGPMIKTGG